MDKYINISHIQNCFGCGVCAIVCKKKIIEIKLNEEGFYEPVITDETHCSRCGLCINVCAFSHNVSSKAERKPVASYAAWSKEAAVRRKCSSGGVGFELGRALLKQGYKVCGVRYNAKKNRAEHYIATTVEELIPSIGSKYIQSYTVDGFMAINQKEKYLVTGTPCQIDSFRRYIQRFHCEDNFVLMDFFCHGVPSMLMWGKYVQWAEKRVGKLTYVSWRNKFTGWHDSWAMSIDGVKHGGAVNWHDSYNMLIKEKKGYLNSRKSDGDRFYKFFLGDLCSNPACHNACRYKYNHSAADIRIGDLWGKTYGQDEDGVSALIALTEKGNELILGTNLSLREHSFQVVAEGQMRKRGHASLFSPFVRALLKKNVPIDSWTFSALLMGNKILRKMKYAPKSIKNKLSIK